MEIKRVTPLYFCNKKPPCSNPKCGTDWWCDKVTEGDFAKNKGSVELFNKFNESFYFLVRGNELLCVEKEKKDGD